MYIELLENIFWLEFSLIVFITGIIGAYLKLFDKTVGYIRNMDLYFVVILLTFGIVTKMLQKSLQNQIFKK